MTGFQSKQLIHLLFLLFYPTYILIGDFTPIGLNRQSTAIPLKTA
jgi:hypothetical protein